MEKRQEIPSQHPLRGNGWGGGGGGVPLGLTGKVFSALFSFSFPKYTQITNHVPRFQSQFLTDLAQGSSLGRAGEHFSLYRTVFPNLGFMDVTFDGLFHFCHIVPLQRYVAETFNEVPRMQKVVT
jgi:hypothetical protein